MVFRLEEDLAFVIWGTGNECPPPVHVIEPDSREAKALRLDKRTFFASRHVVVLPLDQLRPWYVERPKAGFLQIPPTPLRCPPELFLKLRKLGEEGVQAL